MNQRTCWLLNVDKDLTTPLITGSFYTIQLTNIWNGMYWNDACRDWTEDNWRAFVAQQHEIGIDTLICSQMALWSRALFPDEGHRLGVPIRLGCPDPAMVVADEAAKRGMKVWYGLGLFGRTSEVHLFQSGLSKPWPDRWFQWNAELAELLMQRYADTPSFAGFYLSLELGGDPAQAMTCFDPDHIEMYNRWIDQYLRPVIGRSPLLASPAVLAPGDYTTLTQQLESLDVDVIAYQDCGGRGQSKPEDYERIDRAGRAFELLAPVHEKTGIKLWANCETFSRCEPETWRPVSFTGDMERIAYQLSVCAPPVEKIITWIYQGVWNRRTALVDIGPPQADQLHEQYKSYRDRLLSPAHNTNPENQP